MPYIHLPYGDSMFDSDDLIDHIRKTGRDYIIQGQIACTRANHTKPSSLDVWLRDRYARNSDTKQAVNDVIDALVYTGDFEEGRFVCPDNGRVCKGIRIVPHKR